MGCCHVNKCCCCIEHSVGVRILAAILILLEIALIVLSVQIVPNFVFFLVPVSAVGIICHLLLFGAVHKRSRWFILPWLIYGMLLIVGLSLAAVLLIVIPLGAVHRGPEWSLIAVEAGSCLFGAGLYLYFWIVVLELFIKLGPIYSYEGAVLGPPGPPMGPPMAYPIMYQQPHPNMMYQQHMQPQIFYQQQQPPIYMQQQQERQF